MKSNDLILSRILSEYANVENVHIVTFHDATLLELVPKPHEVIFVRAIIGGRWSRDEQIILGDGVMPKQKRLPL